jgi:hypothetical protein
MENRIKTRTMKDKLINIAGGIIFGVSFAGNFYGYMTGATARDALLETHKNEIIEKYRYNFLFNEKNFKQQLTQEERDLVQLNNRGIFTVFGTFITGAGGFYLLFRKH